MKIRELELKDKDKWIKLVYLADNRDRSWAEEKFETYVGSRKKKRIVVSEENGELIGFVGIKGENIKENVSLELNNDYCVVNWIAVLPDFRKAGIGSKLLNECEKYARKWGKKGIWLGCQVKTMPFYERNGYKLDGEFVNIKGKKENLMEKRLK